MNSQRSLDVLLYIPEAGEKPGKNGVMETQGEFQRGEHDQECQCHTEVRLDDKW